MPKIVVWNVEELPENFSNRLADKLIGLVCDRLRVAPLWVEVVFVPVVKAVNIDALNIEIVYSVTDRLHPTQSTVDSLAQDIVQMVRVMSDLPETVTQVTCWIMPQTNTSFCSEEVDPQK